MMSSGFVYKPVDQLFSAGPTARQLVFGRIHNFGITGGVGASPLVSRLQHQKVHEEGPAHIPSDVTGGFGKRV